MDKVFVRTEFFNERGEELALQSSVERGSGSTWMELTDMFIDALGECGYHVTPKQMAEYLAKHYKDRNWLPALED